MSGFTSGHTPRLRDRRVRRCAIETSRVTRLTHALVVALAIGSTDQDMAAAQRREAYRDPVLAAIAAAAEIPAVDSGYLPPGYREIRIRSDQPMVCCQPRPMLRVVEGPADIRGSLWLFRTMVLRPGNPMAGEDERCVPLRDQHICVRPWTLASGDWPTVAARLDQLGAWSLADPSHGMSSVTNDDGSISVRGGACGDCGLLSVQRKIGLSVSSFAFTGPGYLRDPDGLRANEIYQYLIGLAGVIPREPLRLAK
jgi:hypothetical protein